MKKFNEHLRLQAQMRERYENAKVIYQHLSCNNVIGYLDEDASFESIDNYITESLCTSYFTDDASEYWNNIYETLILSHDYKKLINALKEYFGKYWYNSYEVTNNHENVKSFEIYILDCDDAKKIYQYTRDKKYKDGNDSMLPKKLMDIMNFYNYYFSRVKPSYDFDGNLSSYQIFIEPKYSKKVNDMVYDKYHGVLYHITRKENKERILKRGLQLRGNNNLYRYIEPRINMFLANDEDKLRERTLKIAGQKLYKKDDYILLKIDLNTNEKNSYNKSSYHIDFYHDTLYTQDWSVYTYGLIHPRFISVVENK